MAKSKDDMEFTSAMKGSQSWRAEGQFVEMRSSSDVCRRIWGFGKQI